MKQVIAKVISNSKITSSFYQIWLEAPQIASRSMPGQFVMVKCGDETVLPRPFSIHQLNGNKIALLYRAVGRGTTWLAQRKRNENLAIFGPLGNGFSIFPKTMSLVLVAGGIGIAPLRFLADEAIKHQKDVLLLRGAQSSGGIYPNDLLPSAIHKGGVVTEDGSDGEKGLITRSFYGFVAFVRKADQIFACGPLAMYRAMAKMPVLKNKPVQVSLEVVMGCGRGVCYGCTTKTRSGLKKVCEDGPVFDLDEILWDEMG